MKHLAVLVLFLGFALPAAAQETFHVFPQFADGRFQDGTFYRSTLTVLPWFTSDAPVCSFNLYGMTAQFSTGSGSVFSIAIPAGGFAIWKSLGSQGFQGGYATLTCDEYVFANVTYTFYAPNGGKISEATVFTSDDDFDTRIVLDHTEGARLGIAIANNTDLQRSYTVTLIASGSTRNATITVPARRALARFVDELLSASAGTTGVLTVRAPDFSDFYLIGLRFTGPVFTTIPAN